MIWLFAAVVLVLVALLPSFRRVAGYMTLVLIAGTVVLVIWNEHDDQQRLKAVAHARAQDPGPECNIPCKLAAADELERKERGE